MTYPSNPDTIVVRNEYYQRGLREIEVWNYYQSVKSHIMKELVNRESAVVIMADINKTVIRKKLSGDYIKFTPANYYDIITGRTISIFPSMKMSEKFFIIDVDIDPYDGFKWAKKVTLDTYDFIMDNIPIVRSVKIRFTGKTSFHLVCEFNRLMKVDTTRFLMRKFLLESPLAKAYSVGGKRRAGIPNLDLNRNCFRCNYIALHSLSIIGLRCMEVPYSDINSFNPRMAKII